MSKIVSSLLVIGLALTTLFSWGIQPGIAAPVIGDPVDPTELSITLSLAPDQPDPATNEYVYFRIVFSAPVQTFILDDVEITGVPYDQTSAGDLINTNRTVWTMYIRVTDSGLLTVRLPENIAFDYNGIPFPASNTVTVQVNLPGSERGQITPVSATCAQFAAGEAADLNEAVYTVQLGRIRTVTPAAFFYYTSVNAPSANFSIRVTQSNDLGWTNLGNYFSLFNPQINVFDANCSRLSTRATFMPNSITFNIQGATTGSAYIVGIRYQADSVVRRPVSEPLPTATYTFNTWVDNAPVTGTMDSILIKP